MKELYQALAAVQAEMPAMDKSATNPHFRSNYVPLEALVETLNPLLEKHGLLWFTQPRDVEGVPALRYTLIHLESGENLTDVMPLILDKQNSQGLGSAITYARRYALTSVFNIIAELDDDGNKASASKGQRSAAKSLEDKPLTFTEQFKALRTGKKAADIREWAATQGFTLDDVGVDAKDLTKFLDDPKKMTKEKQDVLLEWANG